MQFAFTITFHYLFPQLTMGLSLMIVYFKGKFLYSKIEKYNDAAKFWMKIFALNFAMGVVVPMPTRPLERILIFQNKYGKT